MQDDKDFPTGTVEGVEMGIASHVCFPRLYAPVMNVWIVGRSMANYLYRKKTFIQICNLKSTPKSKVVSFASKTFESYPCRLEFISFAIWIVQILVCIVQIEYSLLQFLS